METERPKDLPRSDRNGSQQIGSEPIRSGNIGKDRFVSEQDGTEAIRFETERIGSHLIGTVRVKSGRNVMI